MTIDVGTEAIDRPDKMDVPTFVVKDNPANATGIITQVLIYSRGEFALEDLEVASFSASGDDLTTRESVSLASQPVGLNTYNAPADFSPFEIRVGDYIGIYFTLGQIECTDSGAGVWQIIGDAIPCTSEAATPIANRTISLYATGYQLGQINIGDVFKDKQNIKINVGDSWKQIVPGSKTNISDVWKDILY